MICPSQGKSYKTARGALRRGGYIESFDCGKGPPSQVRLIRLLKPYKFQSKAFRLEDVELEEEEEEGEGEREGECEGEGGEEEGEGDRDGERVPIVLELPIDVQGYRIIDSFGPHGVNNSVSAIMIE